MKKFYVLTSLLVSCVLLSACDTEAVTSGGGTSADASHCVDRTLRRIYTNDCNYDVFVRLLEPDSSVFRIKDDNVRTRSSSREDFGACRAPSRPRLTDGALDYTCR